MMRLLSLLRAESAIDLRTLLLHAALASIGTTMMLALINAAAAHAAEDGFSLRLLVAFAAALLLYAASQRYVFHTAGREVEAIVNRMRQRLVATIRRANLAALGSVGRAPLYAALTRHTQTISQTLPVLVGGAQQALLLLFAGLYMAWLSPVAFLLTIGAGAMIVLWHGHRMRALGPISARAQAAEDQVFTGFGELLEGFKELRLNPRRSDALMADLAAASAAAREARTRGRRGWAREFATIQALFYGLIGIMVFVVPLFTQGDYHDVVVQATTTALFLIGPMGGLAQSVLNIGDARDALQSIVDLDQRLQDAVTREDAEDTGTLDDPAREIVLEDVAYTYRDAQGRPGFSVGPVSLTLRAGETVFVTGGNGSGKSTLLLLLTGLVAPDSGRILVDGVPVTPGRRQAWRDKVSAIFSDYHLFGRLFGIPAPDPDTADALLARMKLGDKTAIQDGAFTQTRLSAGQRKRLALIAAELERNPVLVLDEWAADQDPAFRRVFYQTLVPDLKTRHPFLILVTHDDRWFGLADRVLHMDAGQLTDVSGNPRPWAPH